MNMQHTPGPWFTVQTSAGHSLWTQKFPRMIADIRNNGDVDLIVAAPDLLAALRALVDYFGPLPDVDNGLDEALTNARAAIAKASGANGSESSDISDDELDELIRDSAED